MNKVIFTICFLILVSCGPRLNETLLDQSDINGCYETDKASDIIIRDGRFIVEDENINISAEYKAIGRNSIPVIQTSKLYRFEKDGQRYRFKLFDDKDRGNNYPFAKGGLNKKITIISTDDFEEIIYNSKICESR